MREPHDIRLKRLRMRAWHRGIKEMDLILGGWADSHLPEVDPEIADAFEAVLAEADHDLYQWVSGQTTPPIEHSAIIRRLALDMRPTMGRGA